jgi:hypothetical protein
MRTPRELDALVDFLSHARQQSGMIDEAALQPQLVRHGLDDLAVW